jgi:hypothetical protein
VLARAPGSLVATANARRAIALTGGAQIEGRPAVAACKKPDESPLWGLTDGTLSRGVLKIDAPKRG